MVSERLWSRIGCEEDACVSGTPSGVAMGGGGMCSTLRDMARFGEMLRTDGAYWRHAGGARAVVADIRGGADRRASPRPAMS